MLLEIATAHPASHNWAHLIKGASASTVFHGGSWISAETAHTAVLLDGREVLAGICVPKGVAANGKPHMIPYAGPLLTDRALALGPVHRRRIHRALCDWARTRHPDLRFSSSPWGLLHPFWVTAGFRLTLLYTYVVDLVDLVRTEARFAPTLRANIRRAQRDGFTVTADGSLDSALLFAKANFSRSGHLPWYDEHGLEGRLQSAISAVSGRVFETHDSSGRSRAAAVIVWDRRRAYYVIGGLDRSLPHRGALALALYEAMRFVRKEIGLTQFDLEGSNQPAIATAFERYSGEAMPYFYVRYQGGNVFDD